MVKRLWLAISVLWAAFWFLMALADPRRTVDGFVFGVIVAPLVIGYIVLRAARFVIRGQ